MFLTGVPICIFQKEAKANFLQRDTRMYFYQKEAKSSFFKEAICDLDTTPYNVTKLENMRPNGL